MPLAAIVKRKALLIIVELDERSATAEAQPKVASRRFFDATQIELGHQSAVNWAQFSGLEPNATTIVGHTKSLVDIEGCLLMIVSSPALNKPATRSRRRSQLEYSNNVISAPPLFYWDSKSGSLFERLGR